MLELLIMEYNKFRERLIERIKKSKRILISSHMNPDDDSISSVLAMRYFIVSKIDKNIDLDIFYTGEIPDRWDYFLGFDKIKTTSDISDIASNYDLIILLDSGNYVAFSKKSDLFEAYSDKTICIDHHGSIPSKFSDSFIDSSKSSCAELIYELLFQDEKKLNNDICNILILGILGDTGNFRYIKSTQTSVFSVASRLVKEGDIDIQLLKSKYQYFQKESFIVFKQLVKNAEIQNLEGLPDFLTSYVSFKFINKHRPSDLSFSEAKSMFVDNYTRSLKGISWGFVLYPSSGNRIKVSMRSLPESINVRELGEKLTQLIPDTTSGGHDYAAGMVFNNVDSEKKRVQDYLKIILDNIEKKLSLLI